MPKQTLDENLVAQAISGDANAKLELWVKVVYPLGCRLASEFSELTASGREEALTRVFAHTLMERMHTLKSPRSFMRWITQALKRGLVDQSRKETHLIPVEDEMLSNISDNQISPEEVAVQHEKEQLFAESIRFIGVALKTLSPMEHEALLLRIQGSTLSMIAEHFLLPGETLATVRERWKKRLPKLLSRVVQEAISLALAANRQAVAQYLSENALC